VRFKITQAIYGVKWIEIYDLRSKKNLSQVPSAMENSPQTGHQ
jgi:hypothetical protein